MTELAYTRCGSGTPLVLLHGLGSSRGAWDPVVPDLAERFDVIAVDLPGFGESAPLRAEPTPAALAAAVAHLLDALRIDTPHVAGNSLGGWVALELARLRPVASLALLSPAGLWRDRTPLYTVVSLRMMRWLIGHATGLLCRLVTYRVGRVLVLRQVHGRPARVDPAYARAGIRAFADAPGYEATLAATRTRHYRAAAPMDAPVTVAFGSRDRILLPSQAQNLGQLPPGTRVASLPGCGHVPMPDDPEGVVALVMRATARVSAA
ncbi:alpha/beta fold hydrolase [Cryptosporangium aurantiacum]|uniref:Pimeloyl-ACP methyl ester carboxylesterase n=1 Tax=Cryptosporangium aurantiacum TaxID=134849 RepID=A0A1M7K0B2_9ACTN|nr:alpha/beta fold hydrolase [Cryptosporangium aurantiacum]SHM58668.1 Pimeloyl-ACP methyl ester carboxylesterase [Cryptosporangium aurantiacum]